VEARRQSVALALLTLVGLCGPAAADVVTFHDAQRGLSFSYDDNIWKPAATKPGRLISIERRLLGGELIGLCNLKAKRSAYAASVEGSVHEEREHITDAMMKKLRMRSPGAPDIDSTPVMAGSQQLIELRVHKVYDPYDIPDSTTIVALVTVYRGEEIMFECGHLDIINRPTTEEPPIEAEIRGILKTLSFAD